MKPVGSFSKWMACGVAIAAMFIVTSAEAASGKAVVRSLNGTAQFADKGGQWETLTSGKVLGPGSAVRTSAGASVQLYLGESGTVTLAENTTLALDRLEVTKTGADTVVDNHFDLRAGTIKGQVKRLSNASRYEVRTPRAVFGIKATDGDTEYQISADGKTVLEDGSAVVVYNAPNGVMSTHPLAPGQVFDPSSPTAPAVRPSRDTDIIVIPGPTIPGDTGIPTVVTAPQPIEFVSPGTGTAD